MKIATAQDFVNVEDISNDILISKDGYVFGYVYVKGVNIKLLSEQEKKVHFDRVTTALENIKSTWQLLSIPRPVNVMGMLDELFMLRKKTSNDAKLKLIEGELNAVNDMALQGAKEPVIILKIWEKANKNAVTLIKKRLYEIKANLENNKIKADILTTQEIVFICKMFTDLTVHNAVDDISQPDEIPVVKGKKKIPSENKLLDLLTPVSGFSFGVNKIIVGNVIGRVFGATRYPSELNYDWLIPIMNNTNSIASITFDPTLQGELAEALSKSIASNKVEASGERDARRTKQLIKEADDADKLLSEIDERNSTIGFSTLLVMPFSADEETFENVCREIMQKFSEHRIKLRPLGNVQKQAYMALSPYYTNQTIVDDIARHIMPLHTITAGSPMTINTYRDDIGYYFGRTDDGGLVSLDLWYRGGDRTNSNIIAIGKPGTGKSTALKHIMETMFMRGVKILVIDPEMEFMDLCKSLGGTTINAGGEGETVINPLEIKSQPPADDNDDAPVLPELAGHLRFLEMFFDLYLSDVKHKDRAKLNQVIIELYRNFGIVWDTDISKITTFPTMKDLHQLLKDTGHEELSDLFFNAAYGQDQFLFNGQTNVDLNNDFVCFNTNALINSGNLIKRTQYFNVLSLCWDFMSSDRKTPVMLVCDEAYLMIDRTVPQSMAYLKNISKRCRKYEGSLAVITHSAVDFLGSEIKQDSQALIDNATYKILFGTDGQNLKETTELYNLTEYEQTTLLSAERGQALFMMGNTRFKLNFVLPEYKLQLMGKAGGR